MKAALFVPLYSHIQLVAALAYQLAPINFKVHWTNILNSHKVLPPEIVQQSGFRVHAH